VQASVWWSRRLRSLQMCRKIESAVEGQVGVAHAGVAPGPSILLRTRHMTSHVMVSNAKAYVLHCGLGVTTSSAALASRPPRLGDITRGDVLRRIEPPSDLAHHGSSVFATRDPCQENCDFARIELYSIREELLQNRRAFAGSYLGCQFKSKCMGSADVSRNSVRIRNLPSRATAYCCLFVAWLICV